MVCLSILGGVPRFRGIMYAQVTGRPEFFLNFSLPRTLNSVPCISFPVCSIHPYLHPHHPSMSCICFKPIPCFFLYPPTQGLGTIVPLALLPLFEMLCFSTFWNAFLPIMPTSVNYWTPMQSATSNFQCPWKEHRQIHCFNNLEEVTSTVSNSPTWGPNKSPSVWCHLSQ